MRSIIYRFLPLLITYFATALVSTTESQESQWKQAAAIADSLQQIRQFDEAIPFWEQAVASAGNSPDTVKQMLRFRLLYGKGLTFNYDKEGIPFFEEAYPLLPASQLDTSRQSTFLNTYYHFLGYNGRWREALPIAEHCVRLRSLLDDDPPLAYISSIHDVAYISNKIGDYPQAIENYQRSIELYIRYNGRLDNEVALGYNNLAYNYGAVGLANKEYEAYRKAANIWENIGLEDQSYLSTVYGNLLQWLMKYGQVDEAESLLAKMRQLHLNKGGQWGKNNRLIPNKQNHENVTIRLSLWSKSIKLYARKGDITRTNNYLDSIVQLLRKIGPQQTDEQLEYLESGYADIGSEYAERGTDSLAIRYFQRALDLKETHRYGAPQSQTHAKMAKSLMAIGDYLNAKEHINKAISTTPNAANLPDFHTLAAQIASKINDVAQVRHHTEQVLGQLTASDELGKSPQIINQGDFAGKVSRNYIAALSTAGHHYLGFYRTSGATSDLVAARNLFIRAAEMLDTYYLGGIYNETLAELLSAIQHGLLESQILAPNERKLSKLISILEYNQSRHSWKKFLKNTPAGSIPIPDSLLNQEETHRRLIVHYKSQLYEAEVDSILGTDVDRITSLLHQEERALQQIETAILALHPTYNQWNDGLITASAIQRKLRNQSILRYVVTDSAAYVFHIHRRGLALYPLGTSSTLTKLAEHTINLLKQRDEAYYSSAKTLHDILLPAELRPQLANQLIIIPDGILHYVPFEALTSTGDPNGFLVLNHTPSYAASLPLWFVQDQFTGFHNKAFAAFAPHYVSAGAAAGTRGEDLIHLPGTATEAAALSNLFSGEVHQGDTVVKSVFWNQAPKYGLLHLAMHAQVDDRNGERSHFLFADRSRLHAYELYGIKLQARLAVLSACNTGNGPLQKGEGVQSLAKAFTYAGVPSLVMGLWQLPDNSTSEIMVGFYRGLKENQAKHMALAMAKKEYLKKTEFESELRHPYYWAGLVVSGNTGSIHTRTTWVYWAILGTILLGGCIYVGRKLNRTRPH